MRLPAVPQRLPPHLRLLYRRPQIYQSTRVGRLYSSSTSCEGNGDHKDSAGSESSTNNSSSSPSFWNTKTSLIAAAATAGLGYGYATLSQPSQSQSSSLSQSQSAKEPQYGSIQDFEKVNGPRDELYTLKEALLTYFVN